MIAADTNVWVRYLTNDNPGQAQKALRLFKRGDEVFVPKTVLWELEWVLRAVYHLPAASIHKAIVHVLGLPVVQVEQPEQVARALALYHKGADFADALHVTGSGQSVPFYTFDRKLHRQAKKWDEAVVLL
ncbi:MAG: type II toxin-antitoxin system VapC family toxin [Acidobacteria bacterium]|nr:type II toxin-antitoxin system VapC family toxin [Acidobacteriota bacterium]